APWVRGVVRHTTGALGLAIREWVCAALDPALLHREEVGSLRAAGDGARGQSRLGGAAHHQRTRWGVKLPISRLHSMTDDHVTCRYFTLHQYPGSVMRGRLPVDCIHFEEGVDS